MTKAGNKSAAEKTRDGFVTSRAERSSYYLYFVGQNIIYLFVSSFISMYFVTKLGIPAATVGIILLASRIWDAVDDPMISVIVEKARLKGGKFKPWINIVAILVPISTVMIFSFTDALIYASMPVKVIYASVTYILWSIFYTLSDAPAFALATVMTPNPDERNTLISLAKTFAYVGVLFAMIATMPIVSASSWFIAAVVMAGLSIALMLQVRRCKERIESSQESPSFGEIIGAITKNKYLLIMVVCMVFLMGFNFTSAIGALVAADVFKNANLTSIIMIATLLPAVFIMPVLPRLIKKFGKITLFRFGVTMTMLFALAKYFAGYGNFWVFMALCIGGSLMGGYTMIMPTLFFADSIEYYFYKTGTRFEAATFAAQTFANKTLGAIAGAGGMWILALLGYKEAIEGVAQVQTQQVVDGMWTTYNLGPAFGAATALVIFWVAYNLSETKLIQMKEDAGK